MEENTNILPAQPKAKNDFADLTIAIATGIALALTAIVLCILPLTGSAGARDFVAYWATGQQLAHHADPYDKDAMSRIEHDAGFPVKNGVLLTRNPPWDLPLMLPLGFMSVRIGAVLWSLLLAGAFFVSVRLLWQMHGSQGNSLHWLGISFAPAMLCITMGQTTLLALLGYVLFLRLHRKRPFLAGVSLWLCAFKPHLFLAFGVVLLTWTVLSKSYNILSGAAAALAASCLVQILIDPTAWTQYARIMRTSDVVLGAVPCPSVALRLWLGPQTLWIAYLPAALACAWALYYYWTRRNRWDWMKHGNLLVLVSLITSPYVWVYDDGLAIPALLDAAYLTRSRVLLAVLALASLVLEVQLMKGTAISSMLYLWTAPAWLAWYLLARAFGRKSQDDLASTQQNQVTAVLL